jgi:hypothetical protein
LTAVRTGRVECTPFKVVDVPESLPHRKGHAQEYQNVDQTADSGMSMRSQLRRGSPRQRCSHTQFARVAVEVDTGSNSVRVVDPEREVLAVEGNCAGNGDSTEHEGALIAVGAGDRRVDC